MDPLDFSPLCVDLLSFSHLSLSRDDPSPPCTIFTGVIAPNKSPLQCQCGIGNSVWNFMAAFYGSYMEPEQEE